MNAKARLTVGLPVYNGARYLAQSLEALCGQTFVDFELVISDNASTDDTREICVEYANRDPRIRYFRQIENVGSAGNHNFVVDHAEGELFKWASHDDLYARDLLRACVDALDANPDVVLAHSWTAMIDVDGAVTSALEYPLSTSSAHAPERFRSMLFVSGGDDIYGVMRRSLLKRVLHHGSYHRAYRPMMAEVSLYGRFHQVKDWLYFRREHPELHTQQPEPDAHRYPERDWPIGRPAVVNLDPRRANRLLHPTVRLYAEYVWGYVNAIRRAPLSTADRLECMRYFSEYLASRAHLIHPHVPEPHVRSADIDIPVDALVAGRSGRDA